MRARIPYDPDDFMWALPENRRAMQFGCFLCKSEMAADLIKLQLFCVATPLRRQFRLVVGGQLKRL